MVIGPTVIGPTPTASTTLLAGPTLTQCLYEGSNNLTSSTVTLYPTTVEKRTAITAAPHAENSVYTLHKCNAAAVNCPEGFGEDIVVTKTAAHALVAAPTVAKQTLNDATGPVTLAPLPTPVVGTFVAAS